MLRGLVLNFHSNRPAIKVYSAGRSFPRRMCKLMRRTNSHCSRLDPIFADHGSGVAPIQTAVYAHAFDPGRSGYLFHLLLARPWRMVRALKLAKLLRSFPTKIKDNRVCVLKELTRLLEWNYWPDVNSRDS